MTETSEAPAILTSGTLFLGVLALVVFIECMVWINKRGPKR